jgi:predicted aminopeptidase
LGGRGRGAITSGRGGGDEVITALEVSYADQERITAWLLQLAAELEAHYAQDISSAEKVAGREAVFQAARERFTNEVLPELSTPVQYEWWARIPTNNAFVLLRRRYHLDLDVFAAVYDAVGGEFAALLDALRDAAGAADPFARLRELAGSR